MGSIAIKDSEESKSRAGDDISSKSSVRIGNVTTHMVARWYRPPEIILCEKVYDTQIDIWSLGCCFAELIYMWSNEENDPDDRYLFKGTSCYPLSPE